ncbi:ribonuclease HII [soil metagenome]
MDSATPNGRSRVSRSSLPKNPSLRHERAAWLAGYEIVAGVDEVGRGAWAGPLVAAAVVLPRDAGVRRKLTRLLNQSSLRPRDSKLVSPDDRVQIVDILRVLNIPMAKCEMSPADIDVLGVGVANRAALSGAVLALPDVDFALLDAFRVEDLTCDGQAIIGGDRRCLSIALASIVAKVHRDQIMVGLDASYPGYGFGQHKGYGTRMHSEALEALGVCEHHRRSFRPVAECLVRV